jgi:hypothetical protein
MRFSKQKWLKKRMKTALSAFNFKEKAQKTILGLAKRLVGGAGFEPTTPAV